MRRLTAPVLAAFLLCASSFLAASAEQESSPAPEARQKTPAQPEAKPTSGAKKNKQAKKTAETKDTKEANEPKELPETKVPLGGSKMSKVKSFLAESPKRLPAFIVGTLVGTPVAFARCTKREIVLATKDLSGESTNPLIVGPCGVLGVPAGIISGALYGALDGMYDSWTSSEENPYSKDAFSLGTLKL